MPECTKPIHLKHVEEVVPCGKCYNCRLRSASGWSFRLMQEDKHSHSSYFLTLTYESSRLTRTPKGFRTLVKRDLQLFFKRLRKAHTKKHGHSSIKYFAVGEYGSKFGRPHYHAIMFNIDESLVDAAWQLGSVYYGSVSTHSVGYTLKYMFKESKIPLFKNDDRTKEFRLISKGLGLAYLTKAAVGWHLAAPLERMYLNLEAGKKCAMPRYYKLKIYTDEQRRKTGQVAREKMLLREQKLGPAYIRTDHKLQRSQLRAEGIRMAARATKGDRF